jgi:hypothetical protein
MKTNILAEMAARAGPMLMAKPASSSIVLKHRYLIKYHWSLWITLPRNSNSIFLLVSHFGLSIFSNGP